MVKTYYIKVKVLEKDTEYLDEVLESLSVSLRDVNTDRKLSSKKAIIIEASNFNRLDGTLSNTYTGLEHQSSSGRADKNESAYADLIA